MPESIDPLIRLEPGGTAPILSYNLPEPTVYTGRSIIELPFTESIFQPQPAVRGDTGFLLDIFPATAPRVELDRTVRDITGLPVDRTTELLKSPRPTLPTITSLTEARRAQESLEKIGAQATIRPAPPPGSPVSTRPQPREPGTALPSQPQLRAQVQQAMSAGFTDRALFPLAHVSSGSLRLIRNEGDTSTRIVDSVGAGAHLATLSTEEVASRIEHNETLSLYTSLFGKIRHRFIPRPRVGQPRLLLVETFRLATYLGAYGAGPTIQTFSLLPGERTTIQVRTFRKTEEERAETSSILDSFSEESASDFESSIEEEQSSKESYEKSFSYHAEAEAKASWGWGSAKVSGGVKGGSNSAREQAAKNTISATDKHAQKASAKRQVEINTSYESRQSAEEENTTSRELQNINVSRTLNFVFRQMNQQFITVLSLVDVRVAFFDGSPESRDEVPLTELDNLLARKVKEEHRSATREEILTALRNIADHTGQVHHDFIEEREVAGETYLRVRGEKTSTYTDAPSGADLEVPGVILSATSNVMRTDGVIVEALLGVGGALDDYSARLQELEVARRSAEVKALQSATARANLINQLIRKNDPEDRPLLELLLAWEDHTATGNG